ncbi:glycosyltransferase family 39 protein [Paenibacillus harenae]|uniref:4-amino-4-deoxy-L-arabinose transferase-like glycosyltransferase n=1 Tax=Paenibacillus harenae TaxID=306543 RepID=A0ABT9U1Y3_PAEHA|nr:glycosyltransferase family 39 protein [Paenibacillus harenae]MDQ0113629.1 4-amino-4-deoxy-L-arabinose transferase-like glycosyltransferase [Paenibacillus harenae]
MNQSRAKWYWSAIAVIFMAGAFLRFDFVAASTHSMKNHDTKYYNLMVQQLLEEGIYAYKDEQPNAKVTPGFPLFLAGIYKAVDYKQHDPFPYVRYIQVLLSLATMAFIFRLAYRQLGRSQALIALVLAAVYPPFVYANGAILTEVLATFLLVLYVTLQLRSYEKLSLPWSLAAGAALGALVLTRPEFLPVALLFVVFYGWKLKQSRKKVLTVFGMTMLVFAVLMSPWWVRNMVTFDKFILLSTMENPLYAGTFEYKNYENTIVPIHAKAEDSQTEVAKERIIYGFKHFPLTFLGWYTVGKLVYLYGPVYTGTGHDPWYTIIPMNGLPLHFLIMLLGALGTIYALLRYRRSQPLLLFIALLVVSMTALRLIYVAEARYTFTLIPLILLLSADTAKRLYDWFAQKYGKQKRVAAPSDESTSLKH